MINLSNVAYQHIRKRLMSGAFPSGAMLSETTLAQEIGVSRTPVREAIAQLEREGLLDQIPRLGTFVRVMDRQEMVELYDFRIHLEGFAALEAGKSISIEEIATLRKYCDEMMVILRNVAATGDAVPDAPLREQWMMADASFHASILQAAKNRWVAKAATDMRLMVNIFGRSLELPGRKLLPIWIRTWREHRRLTHALARHQGEKARDILAEHIRKGKEKLLEYFDWATQNQLSVEQDYSDDTLKNQIQSLTRYAGVVDRRVRDRLANNKVRSTSRPGQRRKPKL